MKPKKKNSNRQSGFNLIELMVVVTIMALLAATISLSFARIRAAQEMQTAASTIIATIRAVQNDVLSGQILSGGQAADAYDLVFTAGRTSFIVQSIVRTGPNSTSTSTVETVTPSPNIQIQHVLVGGSARSPVRVRFSSPFGNVSADGVPSQVVQLNLNHTKISSTKTVTIDGISGRISAQ